MRQHFNHIWGLHRLTAPRWVEWEISWFLACLLFGLVRYQVHACGCLDTVREQTPANVENTPRKERKARGLSLIHI